MTLKLADASDQAALQRMQLCLNNMSRLKQKTGDPDKAMKLLQQVRDIATKLVQANPTSPSTILNMR